jgi:hypothetical protein
MSGIIFVIRNGLGWRASPNGYNNTMKAGIHEVASSARARPVDAEYRARKFCAVVVYWIVLFTRGLLDFVPLIEFLDKQSISCLLLARRGSDARLLSPNLGILPIGAASPRATLTLRDAVQPRARGAAEPRE